MSDATEGSDVIVAKLDNDEICLEKVIFASNMKLRLMTAAAVAAVAAVAALAAAGAAMTTTTTTMIIVIFNHHHHLQSTADHRHKPPQTPANCRRLQL